MEKDMELEQKITAAGSPEEIKRILSDAGENISSEDAAKFFEKVKARTVNKEVSVDELEAVSGGFDRDWLTDGCAATVEPGSWCGSNDSCYMVDVVYSHRPIGICPYCGGYRYSRPSLEEYVCSKCGRTKDWGNND